MRKNPLKNLPAKPVTARLDLEKSGICPICDQEMRQDPQMQIARVGDTLGYICLDHSICLPVENDNIAFQTML